MVDNQSAVVSGVRPLVKCLLAVITHEAVAVHESPNCSECAEGGFGLIHLAAQHNTVDMSRYCTFGDINTYL